MLMIMVVKVIVVVAVIIMAAMLFLFPLLCLKPYNFVSFVAGFVVVMRVICLFIYFLAMLLSLLNVVRPYCHLLNIFYNLPLFITNNPWTSASKSICMPHRRLLVINVPLW